MVPALGAGQRGLAAILASRYVGAGLIIATGLARDARKSSSLRASSALTSRSTWMREDTVARVRELTGGDGVDVVLDLTPMASSRSSTRSTRSAGAALIVLAGLKGRQEIPIPTDMLINKALTGGAFSVDAAAVYATPPSSRASSR